MGVDQGEGGMWVWIRVMLECGYGEGGMWVWIRVRLECGYGSG